MKVHTLYIDSSERDIRVYHMLIIILVHSRKPYL